MIIKATAAEVIEEGQLQDEYFPNCADSAAVVTFIRRNLGTLLY